MSVTQRFRRAVADRDAGAVAVVVAVMSVLLFGVAALVIDIGQAYAKRRAAQTDADLAAFAGAAALPNAVAAFDLAYDYLQKNLPSSAAGGFTLAAKTSSVWTDSNPTNGEITISNANTRIRVVVPNRKVDFGFANALPGGGFKNTNIRASATVEIRSPGSTLPFFLTTAAQSGYNCLKDTSGGGHGSAMRAVLLAPSPQPPTITSIAPQPVSVAGGTVVTISGSNFKNPDVSSVKVDGVEVTVWSITNPNKISMTTPPHAAGGATVRVTNADGTTTSTLNYSAPPAPTVISVSPTVGPASGGTIVTISGTNLAGASAVMFGTTAAIPTSSSNTIVQVASPAGTGVVDVRVTTSGGTSAVTSGDQFTYSTDPCVAANGDFGYLDIPRSKPPTPNGANGLVIVNAAAGIDHGWRTWTTSTTEPLPLAGTECRSGSTTIPGAILDLDPGVNGANCLDVQNGNKTSDVGAAFLEGWTRSSPNLPPHLKAPAGHTAVSIEGHGGMDGDHIATYLRSTVTPAQFVANLANNPDPSPESVAGWIDPSIVNCPRFAIVPVMNVATNPANGFYPIKTFVGVFIDGPAPDYGLDPNNNGTQVAAIHAYAFSLNYLPGLLSAGSAGSTIDYLGAGPKIPVLIHDAADPAY
jgi:Flp pilus assembly protein TadG